MLVVYLFDLVFFVLSFSLTEGYHYKKLLPPQSSITKTSKVTAVVAFGDGFSRKISHSLLGLSKATSNDFSSIAHALDGNISTQWKSPGVTRDSINQELNITVLFGQNFEVTSFTIRAGSTPLPRVWVLEVWNSHQRQFQVWKSYVTRPLECRKHNRWTCIVRRKARFLEHVKVPILTSKLRLRFLQIRSMESPIAYYSIRDLNVKGRCRCNGHADACALSHDGLMKCACQHNTCGRNCERCCRGNIKREQKKSKNFSCKKRSVVSSFDNTNVSLSSMQGDQGIPDQLCFCNKFATRGMQCNPISFNSGCNCLPNYRGRRCESCMPGYYGFPNCLPCKCNSEGSTNLVCNQKTGRCPCKTRIRGTKCDLCPLRHYDFPRCRPCLCSKTGSYSFLCDAKTGQCSCKDGVYGRRCNECPAGYYNFPLCWWCNCNLKTTTDDVCDNNGKCICKKNFMGDSCDQCKPGYYGYPQCTECDCKSGFGRCGKVGECICFKGYTGRSCDRCAEGYYGFPHCLECGCDPQGSYSSTCDSITGVCQCKLNVIGKTCDQCAAGLVGFPSCTRCNCNPTGTKVGDSGSTCIGVSEVRCLCKKNVMGKTCDHCKYGFYDFDSSNADGCLSCACSSRGTVSGIRGCDDITGKCSCKDRVGGKKCSTCINGFYGLMSQDMFGCKDCLCNPGGSVSRVCDKATGRCRCRPNVEGINCDRIPKDSKTYFPNLHHIRAELERAVGDDGIPVLGSSDQAAFTSFSGSGYVVSPKHKAILMDIQVPRSSVYRVIFHYALNTGTSVASEITLSPKGARDPTHRIVHTFRPTSYGGRGQTKFVVLAENGKTAEWELNKGMWTVSINTGSSDLLMDYVALLPEEYYTGSVLRFVSIEPCEVRKYFNKQCSMYKYYTTSDPDVVMIQGSHGLQGKGIPVLSFDEPKFALNRVSYGNKMALLGRSQLSISYEIQVRQAGRYILVIKYLQPDRNVRRVNVLHEQSRGLFEALPCVYTFACLHAVINGMGQPMVFELRGNLFRNKIRLSTTQAAKIGIISLTATLETKWNVSHIKPFFYCHSHGYTCLRSSYYMPKGSSTMMGPGLRHIPSRDRKIRFTVKGAIMSSGNYLILMHYKLIDFLKAQGRVRLVSNGSPLTVDIAFPYCPAVEGCRIKVHKYGMNGFSLTQGMASIMIEVLREIKVIYVLLVPDKMYSQDLFKPLPQHKVNTFLQRCSKNHFYVNPKKTRDFVCHDAIFTMTTWFVGAPFQCDCDPKGSTSLFCNKFGGQCECKTNVVGRRCDQCMISYTGFPQCRRCFCSAVGSASRICDVKGKCKCLPGYGGDKCDRCESFSYYGYPQCKECNCNKHGSLSRFCSGSVGQCQCRRNFDGIKCDKCRVGYFDFPKCKPCNCNPAGMLILPGQENTCGNINSQTCMCKANVQGVQCEECKDLFYGLSLFNPLGCASCGCNTNGTLGGIRTCNKVNGDCMCKAHVTGLSCSRCKSGYYDFQYWDPFGCKRCACNPGASFGSHCDAYTGQCICLNGIGGKLCDRIASDSVFYPDLHHIKFELEDAKNMRERPVVVRNDPLTFPGYSWKGYTELNSYQSRIHMLIDIPRTTNYRMIFYYTLRQVQSVGMLVKFVPTPQSGYFPTGPAYQHKIGARFKSTLSWQTTAPHFLTVTDSRGLPVEVILSQGKWDLILAASPSRILLDYLVLLPQDYYKTSVLTKKVYNPCEVNSKLPHCLHYRHPSMDGIDFVTFEAERALLTGPIITSVRAPFPGVVLDGLRNVLTIDLPPNHPPGQYILVASYFYDGYPRTGILDITWHSGRTSENGKMNILNCKYSFGCRQVALGNSKQVHLFRSIRNENTFIKVSTTLTMALDSITAIPHDQWDPGYLSASPQCVRAGPSCISSTFTNPSDGLVIQAENNTDDNGHGNVRPPYLMDHTVRLAYINRGQRTIYLNARAKPGRYFILVHYFQPHYLSFNGRVIVSHSDSAVASLIDFRYCPHVTGCRSVGLSSTRATMKERISVNLESDLLLTITIPDDKSIWIDYILLVPTRSFFSTLLDNDPVDIFPEFQQKCARNHFQIKPSASHFCLSSVFTLTSRFNRGAVSCGCDTQGSLSDGCQSYGGQCRCKNNVIGRACNSCKTGYTGFPNCRR